MPKRQNSKARSDIIAERALGSLRRNFVVAAKSDVRTWRAWLSLGAIVGTVFSILLVANRSGEFGSSYAASAAITVTAPSGGVVFLPGSFQTIRWNGGDAAAEIRIVLLKEAKLGDIITAFPNITIAARYANTGNFSWQISRNQSPGTYRIRICSVSKLGFCSQDDESDGVFEISKQHE